MGTTVAPQGYPYNHSLCAGQLGNTPLTAILPLGFPLQLRLHAARTVQGYSRSRVCASFDTTIPIQKNEAARHAGQDGLQDRGNSMAQHCIEQAAILFVFLKGTYRQCLHI